MAASGISVPQTKTPLNANQIKGFWAAWGGWCLDGMDAFIYALVLVPALTELLPASGLEVTPGNIGLYGSILQALFLLGWGMSMVWGPIADRFGRVKALMATILFNSVFTFLCGLVTNIWQLAVLRVLCGIGLGGEQPIGSTFVAEELPEEVAAYSDDAIRRLRVKPGVSGLWQVSGRSDLNWEESLRLDLRYADNWSMALDLSILWRTVRAVVKGEGAY